MLQNEVLDLAIGLVMVWFLLSLVVSGVNEALALVFRIRAKHLWLGVGRILDPAHGKYARRFLDTVWTLPVRASHDVRPVAAAQSADTPYATANTRRPGAATQIAELQQVYDALAPQVTDVALAGRQSKLTHIPAAAFSAAVTKVAGRVFPADLATAAGTLGWSPADLAALRTALAAQDANAPVSVDQAEQLAAEGSQLGTQGKTPDDLRAVHVTAAELFTARDLAAYFADNPALAATLRDLAVRSGVADRAAAARAAVERTFDREMDQLSALYRRQNRKVMLLLAVPVVLYFQANAIGTVLSLHSDTNLRTALVNEALATVDTDTLEQAVAQRCEPASTTTAPAATTTTVDPVTAVVERLDCVGDLVADASEFRLIPDWDEVFPDHGDRPWPRDVQSAIADFTRHVARDYGWAGRVITLVALSLGAQFWFDLLRRLVGIRTKLSGSDGRGAAAG